MLTVILSEIAAGNNDAACCIPARKLAGAMAAGQHKKAPDDAGALELLRRLS